MPIEKAYRLGGLFQRMTVRANVSSGLKKIEEALDLCGLCALHGLDHAKSGAFSGSRLPFGQSQFV